MATTKKEKGSEEKIYTYRAGKKLNLLKRPDQFVVRRLPDALPVSTDDAIQVSSASTRISCAPDELEGFMEKSRESSVAHHAYEIEDTGQEFLITDRVIVTFAVHLTAEEVGTFAGKYSLEILTKYSPNKYLFRLTTATAMNPVKLVVELSEKEKQVVRVEHDLNMRFKASIETPSDPHYPNQWHLHQHLQHPEFDERSSARCETAWNLLDGYGSSDVVICVTDDGCKLDHPDFDSSTKFAGWGYFEGYNLYCHGDPGALPEKMYQSGSNHGTSCAGVIGAEIDAEMTVGTAPGCKLLPIKWESSGPSLFISDSKLLNVLNHIADRVDIMSNSWGHVPVSSWALDVRERIEELALTEGRRNKGILFLWAASNDNSPINYQSEQPVPYTSGWQKRNGSWEWKGVDMARLFSNDLVDIPGVLHIAALSSTAQRSHYSNYGPGVELCAPSSNVHAYYRMPLEGLGITTTTGKTGGVSSSFGGTSSATPLVAGIAGLVLSANSQLSALEVASILRRTASKDLNMTGYPKTPETSYDHDPSWDVSPIPPFDKGDFTDIGLSDGTWSPWFGHGKVDAFEAVRAAIDISDGNKTRVRVELTPNIVIPDQDPAGIISQVYVPDPGQIKNIKVFVDIEHSYIGDLIVRLTGPDGIRVDLHYREARGTDDLVKTFDLDIKPELASFLGKAIKGTWMLQVSDYARYDIGKLRRWHFEAEFLADSAKRVESSPGLTIPDQDPAGIVDKIVVAGMETLSGISVDVDMTHTWISDLQIALTSPEGREVVLRPQDGRVGEDIQHTYTIDEEPGLRTYLNRPANGEWTLSVSDHVKRDVGKLNRWGLTLR